MESTLHRGAFPGTAGLSGCKNQCRMSCDIGKDIKGAIVMAEAWCPDAAAIYILAIVEAEFGAEVKPVARVGH